MDQQALSAANELLKAGKLAEAKEQFQAILARRPLDPVALHYVGYASIWQNSLAEGVALMNLAAMLSPGNDAFAQNHLRAARHFEVAGKRDLSIALLRGWQQAHPGCVVSLTRLAKALLIDNRPQESLNLLSSLGEDDSFNRHLYTAIAHQLLGEGTPARENLKRALTVKPLHDLSGVLPDDLQSAKPRVLLVYATDYLMFKPVLTDDVAFSIEGGHFNAHTFVTLEQYRLSRLFVSDSEEFRQACRQLDHFDLILICISDPELNSRSLETLRQVLKNISTPVFNRPEVVLHTSRSEVHQKLRNIRGVHSPPLRQVDLPPSIDAALAAT